MPVTSPTLTAIASVFAVADMAPSLRLYVEKLGFTMPVAFGEKFKGA